MIKLSAFLRRVPIFISRTEDRPPYYDKYEDAAIEHWCPACETTHDFAIDRPFYNNAKWTWNGDVEKPTFNPSMNIKTGKYADPKFIDTSNLSRICHYFLRDGVIEYLGDCTHGLRGQKVNLPPLPD